LFQVSSILGGDHDISDNVPAGTELVRIGVAEKLFFTDSLKSTRETP